ncbi:MAG: exodeoxyribonuclease VII large subunit [Bacteroidia bacterium]
MPQQSSVNKIEALSLSEFTGFIQNTFRKEFGDRFYWIIGEISNFIPRKGSQYFHFVEKDEVSGKVLAELSALSFQDGVMEIEAFERNTGQKFSNGIKVLARVSLGFHPVYGMKLQLHQLDSSFTIGELRKQREATLAKLVAENPDAVKFSDNRYYTRNQSIKLPEVISRIAVISSESSAGLEDFRHTLNSNSFGYSFEIELFATKVQGDENGKKTVEKLIEIFNRIEEFDIVVLVRGGGSQTDFLMYDAYPLSRAIARFPIPVFSGLGHLKDISICDLMSHTSEKTPTKVAERIVSHNRFFEEKVLNFRQQIIIRTQQLLGFRKEELGNTESELKQLVNAQLQTSREDLHKMGGIITGRSVSTLYRRDQNLAELVRKVSTKPIVIVGFGLHEIDQIILNIKSDSSKLLKQHKGYIEHHKTVFRILSPSRTLARGFALVKKDGVIISQSSKIKKGDHIDIYLSGDNIKADIKQIIKADEQEFDL